MAQPLRYATDGAINGTIADLIARARRTMRRQFTKSDFPNLDFDDARWDLNSPTVSWSVRPNFALFYTVDGLNKRRTRKAFDEAPRLPDVFADLVKSWLVLDDKSCGEMVSASNSLRILWRSISTSLKDRPFRWDALTEQPFVDGSQYVESTLAKSAHHYQWHWKRFLGWLQENELVSDGIEWTPTAVNATHHNSAGLRARRLDRLPRREALEALGQIYLSHAKEVVDRLVICALGILLVAGFRLSELLSLPEDCWVEAVHKGRVRYGIRYWNRKTPDGAYKHATRWLSPLGAQLAKQCLDELRSLTHSARQQAKVLESNPERVAIPWLSSKVWLTREETAKALGLKASSIAPLIRNGYLMLNPYKVAYHVWEFRRTDVERELRRRRPPLNTFQISAKKYQKLSDTLLLTFLYETDPQASTSPLLVRTLPANAVHAFLGLQSMTPSAFERFGFNQPYGDQPLQLRSHSLRHWLNSIAHSAGMTVFQITLWMQRKSTRETRLYIHHDSRDIADLAREYIRSGHVSGSAATQCDGLDDESEKEAHLRTIQAGHIVSGGLICIASNPALNCGRNKTCDDNCPKQLAILDDAGAVPELEAKRNQLRRSLQRIASARKRGDRVASRQAELSRSMLKSVSARIKAIRAADAT